MKPEKQTPQKGLTRRRGQLRSSAFRYFRIAEQRTGAQHVPSTVSSRPATGKSDAALSNSSNAEGREPLTSKSCFNAWRETWPQSTVAVWRSQPEPDAQVLSTLARQANSSDTV